MTSRLRAATLLIVVAACKGDEPASRVDTPLVGATAPTVAPAAVGTCPRTGHWGECQLRARLDQAGLAPRDTAESVDTPALGVKATTWMIGRSGIAVYFFADTTARRAAAARLDTANYIAQTRPLTMRNEATLIQNDNVLAILYSRNEHQRERVADVITAGPPQP